MKQGLIIKIKKGNIPFILLFIVCSSKWLFEDIIGNSLIEAGLIFFSLCLLLVTHRKSFGYINKGSQIWLPYILAIVGSLLITLSGINLWGRAAIAIATIMFSVFCNYKKMDYDRILSFLVGLGIFHAVVIFAQFFLKDKFNNIFFPLYKGNSLLFAKAYYRAGYYFGVLCSPHEVSGIVGLALIIKALRMVVSPPKQKIRAYALMLFLLIAFLLTQKKGVIFCCGVSFVATLLIFYKGQRNIQKRILLLFGTCIVAAIGVFLVTTYSNLAIFNRLGQYALKISSGNAVDGSRMRLYSIAVKEWSANKFTGIGWRHFKGLTSSKYGYTYVHEVNCDYLQFLCELGSIGFTLTMITVIGNLVRTLKISGYVGKIRALKNDQLVLLFAIFVQIFTVIYAVIEIPFYDIWYFAIYVFSNSIISKYAIALLKKNNFKVIANE